MKFSQIIPFIFSFTTVSLAQSFCDATGHSGESVKVNGNKIGKIGNVDYQLWADGGNNSATFYSDGSFSCAFQTSLDYLCRTGISFNNGKTSSQIGRIKADFKVVKQSITNVGYAYVGVYGWTKNPRVEYYVVDDWLSPERPGDWLGNQKQGDFTIDGAEYTVYKNLRGDLTQYFSLRKVGRSCGTIDVSAHFDQWEKLGMTMGTLDEVKVLAEIGNGNGGVSGTVEFPYAKVYLGSGTSDQSQAQTQIGQTGQTGQTNQSQNLTQSQIPPTQEQNPIQGQTPPTQEQNPIQGQTPPTQGQNPIQGQTPPTQGQNPIQGQTPPTQGQNPIQGQTPPTQGQNPIQGQTPPTQGQNPIQGQTPPAQGQDPQQNNWGNNFGNNNYGGWGVPQDPAQSQNPTQGQAPPQDWSNNSIPQNGTPQNATPSGNCAGEWAQCGGQGFSGPTCCSKGTCVEINQYYSQCKP